MLNTSQVQSFFTALLLILPSLILLIIVYFLASAVTYIFNKKLIGPEWLPRAASIVFVLIIILYYIFPDLVPFLGGGMAFR